LKVRVRTLCKALISCEVIVADKSTLFIIGRFLGQQRTVVVRVVVCFLRGGLFSYNAEIFL
jgi:hypothetical protein